MSAPAATLIPSTLPDRRTLGPWLGAEFLVSYASTLLMTGCYDYAESLHATPSERLLISACWGLAYIFISFVGGRVAEKFGPRTSSATLCGLCVATALLGLLALVVKQIWMVPLVMLPFNATCTMIWPAIESGLTRSPGRMPLSRRISFYNLGWSSAGFLAMFTHGMLEGWWCGLVFVVPALACGGASLLLSLGAVPASMIGTHNLPDTGANEQEMTDPTVRRRAGLLLKMAWITNPLSYMAIYVLMPLMRQLTGLENLALAGVVGSIWFAVRFVGFALAGKWTLWHYKVRWQIGPLVALAASMAGMLLLPKLALPLAYHLTVLIACQVIFGLATAILYSASLYYAMHVSSGHGGHAAIHEAMIGVGNLVGPMISAMASSGQSVQALPRIAVAVTGLLVLGLGVITWMALGRKAAPAMERI